MRPALAPLALLAVLAVASLPGEPAVGACFRSTRLDPRHLALVPAPASAEPVRVPAPSAVAEALLAAGTAPDPAARRRALLADLGRELDAAWERLEALGPGPGAGPAGDVPPALVSAGFERMKRYEALFASAAASRDAGAVAATAAAFADFDAELRAPHCVE